VKSGTLPDPYVVVAQNAQKINWYTKSFQMVASLYLRSPWGHNKLN